MCYGCAFLFAMELGKLLVKLTKTQLGVKHILPPKDYIKRYNFSKTTIAIRFTLL